MQSCRIFQFERVAQPSWVPFNTCAPQRAHQRSIVALATVDRRAVIGMTATCLMLPAVLPQQARIWITMQKMCGDHANTAEHSAHAEVQDIVSWLFVPPPKPVMFPRKALDQRFAVLLMRASYDAVDDLDFMPMDSFQIKFWKFRQNEQEAYNLQYSPLKARLGDLTDPLYFDFISFAQYAVIAREMPNGLKVFKEFCEECPDQRRLVRREGDNALLPEQFRRLVGDKIYDGLLNGFREEVFGAPAPLAAGSTLRQLTQSIQALLDILVDRGFALKAQVTNVEDGPQPSFQVKLQGPANLWALSALSFRRSLILNDYDAMLIDAYLRACGTSATHETTYSDTGVQQTWTLQA